MIDPTDFEKDCMEKSLRFFGEYVAEIGLHRSFASLTKEEALTMVEVIVTAYQDEISKGIPQEDFEEIPF